jgi:hypothetical protein
VNQTSGYFAAVLPILLCAPKFPDGSMTLGQAEWWLARKCEIAADFLIALTQ